MRKAVSLFALLFAALIVPVTRADTLTYNFITSSTPYGIISTSLPALPTPLSFTADSFQIIVPLVVDGDPLTIPVNFFTAAAGGGASGEGVRIGGPVLFTGATSSPAFFAANFTFGDFNLDVTPETPVVPEAPTLFLFGSGAILGGFLIRNLRLR